MISQPAKAKMAKRLPTILTIIAVLFIITAFILDLSNVGEDWRNFWKNFGLIRFLLILLIVCASGLLLGLFVFYKRKYLDRIKLTIPIAFIIFSLYELSNIGDYYYGLSEYYNYFSAKEDLKNGKVQILIAGQFFSRDSEKTLKAKDSIRRQFGFSFLNVGIYSKGLERYNAVMEEYLIKRNGRDWEKRIQIKMDSVEKLQED